MLRIHLRHELRRESVQGRLQAGGGGIPRINQSLEPPAVDGRGDIRIGPSSAVVSRRGARCWSRRNACEFKRCVICRRTCPIPTNTVTCRFHLRWKYQPVRKVRSGSVPRWSRRSLACCPLTSVQLDLGIQVRDLARQRIDVVDTAPDLAIRRETLRRAATRPGSTVSSTRRLWSEGRCAGEVSWIGRHILPGF